MSLFEILLKDKSSLTSALGKPLDINADVFDDVFADIFADVFHPLNPRRENEHWKVKRERAYH